MKFSILFPILLNMLITATLKFMSDNVSILITFGYITVCFLSCPVHGGVLIFIECGHLHEKIIEALNIFHPRGFALSSSQQLM